MIAGDDLHEPDDWAEPTHDERARDRWLDAHEADAFGDPIAEEELDRAAKWAARMRIELEPA